MSLSPARMEPAGQGQGSEQPCRSNPQGGAGWEERLPPASAPSHIPTQPHRGSQGMGSPPRDRENPTPWGSPSGEGGRRRWGARSPQAALSALLTLTGCSGFLRCSLGHYARLTRLRLAVRGAGAHWDTSMAAGSSPLPLLLSGLVKNKTHCPCAWKTEAWLTLLFKSTAWPPTGQPPRRGVMKRCTWSDKRRQGQRTSLLSVPAMHGWQAHGGVIEGGQMWHKPPKPARGCHK